MLKQGLFYKFILTGKMKTLIFSAKERAPVEVPLSPTQERILMMTCHRGSLPMKVLSAETGLEKGSLTPVVDSLEELGLVKRLRSETDLRSFEVYPTVAGFRQAEIVEDFYDRRILSLLSALDETDREDFIGALDTIGRLIPKLGG